MSAGVEEEQQEVMTTTTKSLLVATGCVTAVLVSALLMVRREISER